MLPGVLLLPNYLEVVGHNQDLFAFVAAIAV